MQVRPGQVLRSPGSMECRLAHSIGCPRRSIVFGEVVQMHVRDDRLDEAGRYVRPEVYQPVARLHSANCIVADRRLVLTSTEALKPAEPA